MKKTPCYVATRRGQLHVWLCGAGPCTVVIAGLTTSAGVLADKLAANEPGRSFVVVDPPGIGGSARLEAPSLGEAAATIAEALQFLEDRPFALLAWELSAALLPPVVAALRRKPEAVVAVGLDRAEAWARAGTMPPDLAPRDDGTHLNALWSFLHDRRILKPDDPRLPASEGEPLPDASDLSDSFVTAVAQPQRFAQNWRICAAGVGAAAADPAIRRMTGAAPLPTIPGAARESHASSSSAALRLPPTNAPPGAGLWHQYIETRSGTAHLRRAGAGGPPVLVIPTGGGSSVQFGPVITGLGATRTAFAFDYFGNGRSDKPASAATIETLAAEAIDILDAMGIDKVDVWGSHTGACVGLEMAIGWPQRVGKLVMEAPVMATREFLADILANYFPDFTPDKFGLHLQNIWNWRRDTFMYWPWYRVGFDSARRLGIPSAEALHQYVVGILESGVTYSRAYRAAFCYDTRARLPLLRRPSMLCAGPNDMLANALDEAARLAPKDVLAIHPTPTTIWWPDPEPVAAAKTLAIYRDFFG